MSQVVVVVDIKAAEGRGDDVVAIFSPAIEKTHAEDGCLKYALHRDAKDPDHLLHVEVWRSQADLDAHFTQPHLAELVGALGEPGLLAGRPPTWFATPIEIGDPAKGLLV
jgi:quinol monooxygenase YgiN